MDKGLKVRRILFESLLDDGDNRKNWEKLCCSRRPLVPFVGAGISAWCYPTWNNLLKNIVEKIYSPECAEIVQEALACEDKPELEGNVQKEFQWMEEIAECIFDTSTDKYNKYISKFKPRESDSKKADQVLGRLRRYVGNEYNKKVDAVNELYMAFSEEKLKENGKMPEYQNLFCKLFQDVLVTTNYDKALESCYSSMLSYSYKDLDKNNSESKSWLYRAIKEKLKTSRHRLEGKENLPPEITVPGMPMLLKVHGSIEQAEDIALSWSGYEQAYAGEMPYLFREIVDSSTMIFLGCGMREDRILAQLNETKNGDMYAILPKSDDKKQKELLQRYGISAIYYDKRLLEGLMPDGIQGEESYHEFFLGLLLENLTRRRMFYPKTLEELWDADRFDSYGSLDPETGNRKTDNVGKIVARQKQQIGALNKKRNKEWLRDGDPQYVHRKQAQQILNLLNTSVECPLIAITGDEGTGKSLLCKSLQELNENRKDPMRFFYISMDECRSWGEFCTRIGESMNLMITDIPDEQKWMEIAQQASMRCGAYWRSVLILDQLGTPDDAKNNDRFWDTIKNVLRYWKENHIRVIFVCQSVPQGISCYTWQIEQLRKDEARKVFFNACRSMRDKCASERDRKIVNAWLDRYGFKASEVNLLGKYANSKNSLLGLLEEWDIYYKTGDTAGQTIARMLWRNLLAEHGYYDKKEKGNLEECETIKKNILWIWGILGKYPGSFPHKFFEIGLAENDENDKNDKKWDYKDKCLSLKTLIYMKNCGLCEEIVDEQHNNILENMIVCVRDNFVNGLGKSLVDKYNIFLKEFHGRGEGMVWFRGYSMHSYEKSLLKDVRKFSDVDDADVSEDSGEMTEESVKDILDLLHIIGEKVRDGKARSQNAELDVILHYEIKTVIRFLHDCLTNEKFLRTEPDKLVRLILEIGADFYTYYQYVPDHAFAFVKLLIEKIENRKTEEQAGKEKCRLRARCKQQKTCKEKERCADEADWDVSIARLSKIMGDIYRLLGKKDESIQSYQKALQVCDSLVLSRFWGEEKDRFEEILHIKAGVMVAANYYEYDEDLQKKAEKVYPPNDKAGLAYFNQRTAEMKLDRYNSLKNSADHANAIEDFREMKKYYLNALRLFKEFEQENDTKQREDNTKIAYMLKCIGDFIVGFRKGIWDQGNTVSYNMEHAVLEVTSDETRDKEQECDVVDVGWFYAAADFYLQAFIDYCSHINWRGLVNVIQAMGTCMRERDGEKEKSPRRDVENVYNMAEECFRWLGDVRGLADTLDYFGYYYNDIKGKEVSEDNVVFKYMALGKWRESRKVWEQQGNREKSDRINNEIQETEKQLEKYEKLKKA